MKRWILALGWLGTLSSASAAPQPYERSIDLVQSLYMYPDDASPEGLVLEAARHLERRISWLFVDADETGVTLRHGRGTSIGRVDYPDWPLLADALFSLETQVFAAGFPLEDIDLRLAVLDGMTRGLDRYTRILAGETLTTFDTRIKGTLVGIGATLGIRDEQLKALAIIPDGPAMRGGLEPGDEILEIDGVSTVNIPVKEAVRRIRGDRGTEVRLRVRRYPPVPEDESDTLEPAAEKTPPSAGLLDVTRDTAATPTFHELTFQRDRVVIQNVQHRMLEDGVAWVRIDSVSQRTVANLALALQALADQDGLEVGLVLDLRGNTGGSMRDSAGVVDTFVRKGNILTTTGPDGEPVRDLMSRYDARRMGREPQVPLVVLVDRKTASGAEIISGALKGLGRAVVLGQRTYGKGQVQKTFTLEEGVRLKITVAEYQVADGVTVAGDGVVPDRVVGRVLLSELGARFIGWDTEHEGTTWSSITPMVDEREGWLGVAEPAFVDVPLEAARRAVLGAAGDASRDTVSAALEDALEALGAEQDALLVARLAERGMDWSPATGPGSQPEADVALRVSHDPEDPNVHVVHADVTNQGVSTLRRALVRLESEDFSGWDGLLIPVGAVPSGATVTGEVRVRMRPGVDARRDGVTASLLSDQRPPLPLPDQVLDAEGTPRPRLRVEAALVAQGDAHVAEVRLKNLSSEALEGLEVFFAYPTDIDVELLDRASRVPSLGPKQTVALQLRMRLGADAPPTLPMRLNAEADGLGRLEQWELALRRTGEVDDRQAPRIAAKGSHLSTDVGAYTLPLVITDDESLDYVTVFANDRKVLWTAATGSRLDVRPVVQVEPGSNAVLVVAVDDEGQTTKKTFRIFGESAATADKRHDDTDVGP